MMKQAHSTFVYVTLLLGLVLLVPAPGRAKLVNYGRNDKEPGLHFDTAPCIQDTIPAGERETFDRPFGADDYKPHNPNPFPEEEAKPSLIIPTVKVEVDTSYAQVQKLPRGYSGYKIEIKSSREPLPAEHDIFFQHGNLVVDHLKDGAYSYLLGNFQDADAANAFLHDFLINRYPEAKVVEYEAGGRLY